MLERLARLLKPSRAPAPPAKFHSRFGGLWIDRQDARQLLAQKALADPRIAALRDKIAFFMDNGYVILERAVDPRLIDAYLAELEAASRGGTPLLASVPQQGPQDKDVVPLKDADIAKPLTKVLDTYVHLPAARPLIFSDAITNFLRAVFEDGVLAFQGLHFERGSTQAIHQDTAYVVLEEPMRMCASWIALEDVVPGSGELIYYRGSHRLPDWLYSGEHKHFNHERDPHEQHMGHLSALHERSKERGLPLESFLPKKGDALIWAADLAHGGSQITDPTRTRRSLVTHYAPASVTPYYFRFIGEDRRVKKTVKEGCSYCTMYY
jgi:phytanoyl-CoA hydroxylase